MYDLLYDITPYRFHHDSIPISQVEDYFLYHLVFDHI